MSNGAAAKCSPAETTSRAAIVSAILKRTYNPPSLQSMVIRQCFNLRLDSESFDDSLDQLVEFAAKLNRLEVPCTLRAQIFFESCDNIMFDLPREFIQYNGACKKCYRRNKVHEFHVLCHFFSAGELFCRNCLCPLFTYI